MRAELAVTSFQFSVFRRFRPVLSTEHIWMGLSRLLSQFSTVIGKLTVLMPLPFWSSPICFGLFGSYDGCSRTFDLPILLDWLLVMATSLPRAFSVSDLPIRSHASLLHRLKATLYGEDTAVCCPSSKLGIAPNVRKLVVRDILPAVLPPCCHGFERTNRTFQSSRYPALSNLRMSWRKRPS